MFFFDLKLFWYHVNYIVHYLKKSAFNDKSIKSFLKNMFLANYSFNYYNNSHAAKNITLVTPP